MSEKQWNAETSNWEIDGKSVNYRVTWMSFSDGLEHTREFTDVDQGYSFYEDMQKSPNAYAVKWDHIPW